tara:strand:- start:82 stop:336 length:255 start_codon:yes stop_codon:yes gene_type:complete
MNTNKQTKEQTMLKEDTMELLKQLRTDVDGDTKQLEIVLGERDWDNDFLFSRGTMLKEIRSTLQCAMNILEELEEEENNGGTFY